MTTETFPVDMKRLPTGAYEATLPDIPGVVGRGRTDDAAYKDLSVKAMTVIGTMREAGTLPKPSAVTGRWKLTVTPPIRIG